MWHKEKYKMYDEIEVQKSIESHDIHSISNYKFY